MESTQALMYYENAATGNWAPWQGPSAFSAGVTLYNTAGQPVTVTALGAPLDIDDGLTLWVAGVNYGYNSDDDAFEYQYNLSDGQDVDPVINQRVLAGVVNRGQIYTGAVYERLRALPSDSDAQAATQKGLSGVVARTQGFNGTTWDRLYTLPSNSDAQVAAQLGLAGSVARTQYFNGTTWDRARSASAANLALQTAVGAALSEKPGDWSITHTPAANTQATITRAAGAAGTRHVCTSISVTLIGLAAAVEATVLVNLRDGATGAGTILWSARMLVTGTAGSETGISISDLNIVGSDATAMTLEFAAAGGANTFETVALTGHDAS
jgi:hypothetical protein